LRFRNSERKKSTSSAIRAMTPSPLEGLSIVLALIQGSDFCWPVVVGIRKGTGELAHFRIRYTIPPTNITNAA
jgi:hypothetical protein